ncbi:MAG: hypothetical protein JST96_09445 [Bacteroidetes bacterium]|nr:hypothetical protein [Bacteroidota bacterium]
MNFKFSNSTKIVLVITCFIASVIGFLVKLPSAFHHIDKQLHFSFYFLAAAFLNILFNIKNLIKHILVSALLYAFGICIEFAQGNYNKVFHVHIHGRFDPEDVKANLHGLIAFSIMWAIVILVKFAFQSNKKTSEKINN